MDERKLAFATHLRALNQQFARWVDRIDGRISCGASPPFPPPPPPHPPPPSPHRSDTITGNNDSWVQAQSIDTLWADAARDYVSHADKLARDFADVLGEAAAAERADAGGNAGGAAFGLFSGRPAGDEPSTSPTKRAATVAAVAAASAPSPGPGGTVNGFSFGAPPADAAAAAGASPMTAGLFGAANTKTAGAGGEGFGGGSGGFGGSGFGGFGGGGSAAAPKPAAEEAAAAKPAAGGFSFGAPSAEAPQAPPAAKPAFTFGAPAEPDDDEPAAPAPAGGNGGLFSFGAAAATAAADKEAADKPAPAAGGSLFSFGNAAAAAAGPPAPSLFNFGGPGAAASGGGGAGGAAAAPAPFSFGAPPAPFGAAAAPQADGAADDDDEGPRKFAPEVQLDSEAYEVLFSAKAKFMVQVKDPDGKGPLTWDPRGLGLLSLRRPRDGKRTPIIMFTTDAGRSLLASPLSATTNPIVPQNQPKRVLVSVLLADAPKEGGGEAAAGGAEAPKTYSLRAALFQMGAPEKVSEFKEAVLKGRPAAA